MRGGAPRRAPTASAPDPARAAWSDAAAAARRTPARRGRAARRASGSPPTSWAARCRVAAAVGRVVDGPSCDAARARGRDAGAARVGRGSLGRHRGTPHRGRRGLPGALMEIDVFTLFPGWFDWFAEQRHVRNALALGHSLRGGRPARHHAARGRPGGRHALRRRRGHGDPGGRGGGGAEARYGGDPVELRGSRRVIALAAGGRRFDDALAAELAAEPELTLLCGRYEGFDERVHEHLATDVVSIGPVRAVGRRAGGDGGLRRRDPQAPGRARPRGERRGGVVQRGARGRAGVPALHAPGGVAGPRGAGGARSPATTPAIREWRLEQSRRRGGGD